MKRVLIISPYFAPCNAADSQRVRMSLSFFKGFGWEAEVVCVDEKYCDINTDELLLQSIPAKTIIHRVKALPKKWTVKIGLGSLALRAFWFYRQKVMLLLQAQNYDLIYFSTTEFPVCVLGRVWKRRFGVPYIIDMQDAWHTTYYQDKPKNERPNKYWFSYRLHKYLEPLAMKNCNGLISVSAAYISTLHQRYPRLKTRPAAVIPFGYLKKDFEIARSNVEKCPPFALSPRKLNVVYIGRGGADMQFAFKLLFSAVKEALQTNGALLGRFHFYFIGTSYAPDKLAKPTISPIAQKYGLHKQVTELTGRIGFYSTINTLLAADALFLPGSTDPEYSASKIYPYLQAQKPVLAIVHPDSLAVKILEEYGVANVNDTQVAPAQIADFLLNLAQGKLKNPDYSKTAIKKYSAKNATFKQCALFDEAINATV